MVAARVVAEWSSPSHVIVNVLSTVVWIAALVSLVRSPREHWYNRRGAVLMGLIVAFASLYVDGFFVPIGAIGWFGWWRWHGGLGRLPQGEPIWRKSA